MELIKPQTLAKDRILEEPQAKLILKKLREGKKDEREDAIMLVEIIFSIILRKKIKVRK